MNSTGGRLHLLLRASLTTSLLSLARALPTSSSSAHHSKVAHSILRTSAVARGGAFVPAVAASAAAETLSLATPGAYGSARWWQCQARRRGNTGSCFVLPGGPYTAAYRRLPQPAPSTTSTLRMLSGGGADDMMPPIAQINKEQLEEILEDVREGGREGSGYVVIDVRGDDEVASTGKLSDDVVTLPLPYIQKRALSLEEEDFLDEFGFAKPSMDETLVFTCKAGIRSNVACQFAAMEGYTNLINYSGGANDWFG